MPTLNRFPLLGLWAREAARRLGPRYFTKSEADALGHAYAVLYAIRAAAPTRHKEKEEKEPKPRPQQEHVEEIQFAGDKLPVVRDRDGRVRGLVGGDRPQTPATYQASVEAKFPEGYYEKLEAAFQALLKTYPPRQVNSRLLYQLYDEWKRACGVGRRVDLDKLLAWCRKRTRENQG